MKAFLCTKLLHLNPESNFIVSCLHYKTFSDKKPVLPKKPVFNLPAGFFNNKTWVFSSPDLHTPHFCTGRQMRLARAPSFKWRGRDHIDLDHIQKPETEKANSN